MSVAKLHSAISVAVAAAFAFIALTESYINYVMRWIVWATLMSWETLKFDYNPSKSSKRK